MKFHSKSSTRRRKSQAGINLVEILVVITIISILTGVAVPGYRTIIDSARAANDTQNLRGLVNAAFKWASDNAEKLPSPKYPGGHQGDPPKHWDFAGTGTGLWCDGTLFHVVYGESDDPNVKFGGGSSQASNGGHLFGSIFESQASVKADTSERDWYRHSFAMNSNLQYDKIHELSGSSDPWLTEKTYGNLQKMSQAMLFIDCNSKNVVDNTDLRAIIDTGDTRRRGYVLAAFLDGHIEKLREPAGSSATAGRLPRGNPDSDRAASAFWRGVDIK